MTIIALTPEILQARGDTLRATLDTRCALRRAAEVVASIFRQIAYFIVLTYHKLFGPQPQQCDQEITWNQDSIALVVALTGLNGFHATYNTHRSFLEMHTNIDLFIPAVPNGGACRLEEAGQPILDRILTYVDQHPNKPICLIGVSNGSRIAAWIETSLRYQRPSTPVKVSTIAGVLLGTSRMNTLVDYGIAQRLYPPVFYTELQHNSEKARWLIGRIQADLPPGCAPRCYQSFATADDLVIPNMESSLPDLTEKPNFQVKKHRVVYGHSHDSIVAAIAERQTRSCVNWIHKIQPIAV